MGGQDEGGAQARHHPDLDAKFIALVCLALADALNLWGMQTVELVPALRVLRHIAGTKWGTRRYLNMETLKQQQLEEQLATVCASPD